MKGNPDPEFRWFICNCIPLQYFFYTFIFFQAMIAGTWFLTGKIGMGVFQIFINAPVIALQFCKTEMVHTINFIWQAFLFVLFLVIMLIAFVAIAFFGHDFGHLSCSDADSMAKDGNGETARDRCIDRF